MRINDVPLEEVFRLLKTSEKGLSLSEAQKRLSYFGYNEIREIRKRSFLLMFLSQFTHFLALILWLAALLAFFSDFLHPGEGMRHLGWAIVTVIIINALFAFVQEYKAERAIEKLKLLFTF